MSDEFTIDFGTIQNPPAKPKEGDYLMVITDFSTAPPKKESSKGKGLTAKVTLAFEDGSAEAEEYSGFKAMDWIWIHFENPFGAEVFFSAVTGQELVERDEDGNVTGGMKLNVNPALYIGEKVGVTLENVTNESNGRTFLKPTRYYSVSF